MEESGTKPPIQPTVDAITPNRATAQKSAEPPQDPPIPPYVPPPQEHKADTCHCRPDQTPVAKIALEVFGAAVIFAYTIAAYWQLGVVSSQLEKMQLGVEQTERAVILNKGQLAVATRNATSAEQANTLARDALVSVQRAFVIFEPLPTVHPRLSNGTVAAFQFQFKLENAGNTPTKDMAFHLNTWRDFVPMTKGFPFNDLDATGKKCANETQNGCQRLRVVLGPKGYTTSGLLEVDTAIAQSVNKHIGHVYFYGTTTYRDIFPNTKTHRTEMCEELVFVDTANNTFATTDCPYHNCTDDECDEEDRQRSKQK